ncbi:MAG: hypothetical protein HQL47_04315 [Gammaproteobacteria bacterium]|nr:hypothetical protein [Gammaproteobacteria bacterium]
MNLAVSIRVTMIGVNMNKWQWGRTWVAGLLWLALGSTASLTFAADQADNVRGFNPGGTNFNDLFTASEAPAAPAAAAAKIPTPAVNGQPLSAGVGPDPDKGERCNQMSRQIEALKGKPLQRSALSERFQQECALY